MQHLQYLQYLLPLLLTLTRPQIIGRISYDKLEVLESKVLFPAIDASVSGLQLEDTLSFSTFGVSVDIWKIVIHNINTTKANTSLQFIAQDEFQVNFTNIDVIFAMDFNYSAWFTTTESVGNITMTGLNSTINIKIQSATSQSKEFTIVFTDAGFEYLNLEFHSTSDVAQELINTFYDVFEKHYREKIHGNILTILNDNFNQKQQNKDLLFALDKGYLNYTFNTVPRLDSTKREIEFYINGTFSNAEKVPLTEIEASQFMNIDDITELREEQAILLSIPTGFSYYMLRHTPVLYTSQYHDYRMDYLTLLDPNILKNNENTPLTFYYTYLICKQMKYDGEYVLLPNISANLHVYSEGEKYNNGILQIMNITFMIDLAFVAQMRDYNFRIYNFQFTVKEISKLEVMPTMNYLNTLLYSRFWLNNILGQIYLLFAKDYPPIHKFPGIDTLNMIPINENYYALTFL